MAIDFVQVGGIFTDLRKNVATEILQSKCDKVPVDGGRRYRVVLIHEFDVLEADEAALNAK